MGRLGRPELIIGIDPGLSGAVAKIGEAVTVIPMPTIKLKKKNIVDIQVLVSLVEGSDSHVIVEQQHAFPKQGGVSNFSIGYGFGAICGILTALRIPFTVIPAQRWKKAFGLFGKGKGDSILVAKRLFPGIFLKPTARSRKDSDGMAEALLIAEYGRRLFFANTS